MCSNPKWIYKKGNYKEDTFRGYAGKAYEIGLWSKCGTCAECAAEKANNWVIRNYYEAKAHEKKCFITLTYEDNPHFLVRKDLQNFMKRLRNYLNEKVRIFYAGEYGTIRNRPHQHIIIYGWEDEKKEYLNINKKGNIIYQSKLIQDVWGLGRTSYQSFSQKEAPYIALYNTNNNELKKDYLISKETVRYLEKHGKNIKDKNQRKNFYEVLNQAEKELNQNKKQYVKIKEYNGWSLALGWEEFEKQYNSNNYAFEEYIENKTFLTPTPWLKKLANRGDEQAIKEIFRREEEIKTLNRADNKQKILLNTQERAKKEITEWQEKQKNEGFIL